MFSLFVTARRNDHADKRLPNNWGGARVPNWMVWSALRASTFLRTFITRFVQERTGTDILI